MCENNSFLEKSMSEGDNCNSEGSYIDCNTLKLDESTGSSMCQSYGLKSRKTSYNNQKNNYELAITARASYNIQAVFQCQMNLGISLAAEEEAVEEEDELAFC
ncbi:hypothetical protein C7212DRAFT_345353 [Tuber magnatum]|uniref:Uncharacterized protein n=1 Tax=Tuber magnatum TaxID=42249 RepID=A0A317SM22_9PEZI|nr:hypothetical protein C7212DRAFT_345353 [Tuber magnatum]